MGPYDEDLDGGSLSALQPHSTIPLPAAVPVQTPKAAEEDEEDQEEEEV